MKKYLPLGSVVSLKKAQNAKFVIIGRSQIADGKLYDYSACLFPQGYTGSDHLYAFNNDDVDTLYFNGMQNDEEFEFRKALIEAEEAMNKEENTSEEA